MSIYLPARVLCVLLYLFAAVACGETTPLPPVGPSFVPPPPVPPLPPLLSKVLPDVSGPGGGAQVAITGARFESGAKVTFDGLDAPATVMNATTILATPPPHSVGIVDVVVRNPDGQLSSSALVFTYVVFAPPTVDSISKTEGLTAGGQYVTLRGSGFSPLTTVAFGDKVAKAPCSGSACPTGTFRTDVISVRAPTHPAGVVDIILTNPDSQPLILSGAFTYIPPESVDFNGEWEGRAGHHWDFEFRFTIEHGLLTAFSCGGAPEVRLSSPPATLHGEFSVIENGTRLMDGSFDTEDHAEGTINVASCPNTYWEASRKPATTQRRR